MADRLRIVNARWPKPPSVVADLSVVGVARDSFKISAGDAGAALSASSTRWGGARVTTERRGNATLTVSILVASQVAATPDAAIAIVQNALESSISSVNPDLAIEWRPAGATYSAFWRVRGPASYQLNYSWAKFFSANMLVVDVSFPVAPLAEGAPYDIFDDFSVDTIATGDWKQDAGVATLSVQNGQLAPSQTSTTPTRYHHARGYPYGDVEVVARVTTGATLTNGVWSACLGMDTGAADTMLCLELTSSGSNVVKWVAGVRTVLSSAGSVSAVANTTYFLLLRRAGNVLYWRVSSSWNWSEYTVEPNTYTLTGADLRLAAPGYVGLKVSPADVNERYDDFSAKPWVYRGILTPEHVKLLGPMVGDAPALADVEVTPSVSTNASGVLFGLVAWSQRPLPHNICHGGDLSTISASVSPSYGWASTAVSGVIAAATSVARNSTATRKYGRNALQVVCPATTDTGATWLLERRFKRGTIYAAWSWLAAASGTTLARVKLGVSGDLSTETAVALSTTPTLHAVTWQPTADYDFAYMALGINAATATTFDSTGMVVVECPTVTLAAAISSTSATTMSVWYTPGDVPFLNPDGSLSQPFLALIDKELVLVTAIAGATWTIARGQESTTAATHAVDALVCIAPTSRLQYEGKGAAPPFAVIEGEDSAKDRVYPGTRTSSASFRGGAWQNIGASSSGHLDFYLDPSLVMPDDFSQGDLLVEVWGVIVYDGTASTFPNAIVLSAEATESYNPDIRGSSVAGTPRYTLEYGTSGITIPVIAGATNTPGLFRLGTLPLTVDKSNPQRVRLMVELDEGSSGAGIGIDYLVVTPAERRAATPTGKASSDATYPSFLPGATAFSNAVTKILRADGSGAVKVPRLGTYTPPYAFPDAGLGHGIELGNGDNDLIVKLAQSVPNDPTGAGDMPAGAPNWTSMIHVAATPRFATARGS